MRLYDRTDEEQVRLQRLLREWAAAGLLDPVQAERLDQDVGVDLRRTGFMLRAGLAFFTAIVIAASVLLVTVIFELSDDLVIAVTCVLAGIACVMAARRLAVVFRFYRHGVEETLAIASCLLFAVAALLLTRQLFGLSHRSAPIVAALLVGAVAAYIVYRMFGFRYAAIGSLVCLAAIPYQFSIGEPLERLLSAAVFICGFAMAGIAMREGAIDADADDAAVVQAAAFAGTYLTANLYVTHGFGGTPALHLVDAWFRWTTFALIWILPAAGLWIGIRKRQQWLLDVAGAAAVVTLVSNKPYLGLVQRPWDAIALGVLLVGGAFVIRRWLASAPEGERGGFTAQQILAGERERIDLVAMASSAVDPRPALPENQAGPSPFEGGRSGGGGGGTDF